MLGTLPERGIQPWTVAVAFLIDTNSFAGALPMSLAAASMDLTNLIAGMNDFEGCIPPCPSLSVCYIGHTNMEGTIPEGVLAGGDPSQNVYSKIFVATGVTHEGSIPTATNRMTCETATLTFGHGLKGFLPRVRTTVHVLSLWQNGLEGHLPELHISFHSKVIVHANRFSCQLPRNGNVRVFHPGISLGLVGNHFALPKPERVPAWIAPEEQPPEMFCISNNDFKSFASLLACGPFLLTAVTVVAFNRVRPGHRSMYGKFARARSAWSLASNEHGCLLLVSCVVLAFYSSTNFMPCMVVSHHLRFHFQAAWRPIEVCLLTCVHGWTFQLARCSDGRHTVHQVATPYGRQRADADASRCPTVGAATSRLVWLLLCLLTSAPAVLYAMVKSVPGALSMPPIWKMILSNAIALWAGLVAGIVLPWLADLLGRASDRKVHSAALELFGKLIAGIVLPCIVTVLCDAHCVGGWARFWSSCDRNSSLASGEFRLEHAVGRESRFHRVLTATDVCSLQWQMERRDCAEAVMERLGGLLYPKFALHAFTLPSFLMVKVLYGGNGMTLEGASAQLRYTWLVVSSFGPFLPVVQLLVALLVKIHCLLLFSFDGKFLHVRKHEDKNGSVQRVGLSSVAVIALLLQTSNWPLS